MYEKNLDTIQKSGLYGFIRVAFSQPHIIARPVDDDDATTIASLMVDAVVIRPLWGHSPGNKANNNQLK